jgi:hypothetical protein
MRSCSSLLGISSSFSCSSYAHPIAFCSCWEMASSCRLSSSSSLALELVQNSPSAWSSLAYSRYNWDFTSS